MSKCLTGIDVDILVDVKNNKNIITLTNNAGYHGKMVLRRVFDQSDTWRDNCDLTMLAYTLLDFARLSGVTHDA